MLNKIKALADEAIALQNKNRMDEVLREISALCEPQEIEDEVKPEQKKADITEEKPRKGGKNAK